MAREYRLQSLEMLDAAGYIAVRTKQVPWFICPAWFSHSVSVLSLLLYLQQSVDDIYGGLDGYGPGSAQQQQQQVREIDQQQGNQVNERKGRKRKEGRILMFSVNFAPCSILCTVFSLRLCRLPQSCLPRRNLDRSRITIRPPLPQVLLQPDTNQRTTETFSKAAECRRHLHHRRLQRHCRRLENLLCSRQRILLMSTITLFLAATSLPSIIKLDPACT
jgi:hypothetical protein